MVRTNEIDGFRTLARYKRLILLGKASLPLEVARRIVGPDCAYHLYFRSSSARSGNFARISAMPTPSAARAMGSRTSSLPWK